VHTHTTVSSDGGDEQMYNISVKNSNHLHVHNIIM